MHQNQTIPLEKVNHFFTQVKDTHKENGQEFITLFARLTVENAVDVTNVWVEIDEVKMAQASKKLQQASNGMTTYLVSEAVFQELVKLSQTCHTDLYYLTPIYEARKYKPLS